MKHINDDCVDVSWLIPAHLPTPYLKNCIASCLGQNFERQEVLIVANGNFSSDIKRLISTWFHSRPEIIVITTEIASLGYALNLGIDASRGAYIARLDSDDIADSGRITAQLDLLNRYPCVDMVASGYSVIDEHGDILYQRVRPSVSPSEITALLFRSNVICHPSCTFRKDAIVKLGGYRLHGLAEDYDLWIRLAMNKPASIAYLSAPLTSFRHVGLDPTARRSPSRYLAVVYVQWLALLTMPNRSLFVGLLLSILKLSMALIMRGSKLLIPHNHPRP